MQQVPDAEAEFLNSGSFDHTPMTVILYDNKSRGPIPFKFFNYWSHENGFKNIVEEAWKMRVRGNPMYKLVHKLKNVKQQLTIWRKAGFYKASTAVEQARARMTHAQQA